MDKKVKISKLSKDEAGKLRGGFSFHQITLGANYESTNIRKYFYDIVKVK